MKTLKKRPDDREISTAQKEGIRRLLAAMGGLAGMPGGGRKRGRKRADEIADSGLELDLPPPGERYVREEEITRGGMGAIYRASDRVIGRISAMKLALPEILTDPESSWRFVTEAKITALLEHPNIVPVHDIGKSDRDGLFFIMKLVAGEPLSTILYELRRGDPDYTRRYDRHDLLVIFRKVCDAVAFAHSRGVIHRDIKPHNIMVGPYGEVLLMDWGLAKFEDLPEGSDPASDPARVRRMPSLSATTDGVVKGTPSYMAPEQAAGRGRDVDRLTDIYLLGTTLYHIVTLEPPFTGVDAEEILLKAMGGRLIPPNERNPACQAPEELWRIIRKCAARRKDERYRSVEELVADLDAWMAGRILSQHRRFEPGEYLMRSGEIGTEAYLIVDGRVEVFEKIGGRNVPLNELGPGDIVGEMALLTDETRSASVVALAPTEVQIITRETMHQVLRGLPPWMDEVVTTLARRLQNANVNIHPLMAGDCTYQVLNQFLLEARGRTAPPLTTGEGPLPGPDLDTAARRIALCLSVPSGRVRRVLDVAVEAGLLAPDPSGDLVIVEPVRFERFLAHCGQAAGRGSGPDVGSGALSNGEAEEFDRIHARITARLRRD